MRLFAWLSLQLWIFIEHSSLTAADSNDEEIQAIVGVHVVCDLGVYRRILYPQGYEKGARKGSPSEYFSALLEAVEMRFRGIQGVNITFRLVNLTAFSPTETMDISVHLPGYYETINGTATLENFKQKINNNSEHYKEGDMVVYVTSNYVLTKDGQDGKWYGLAEQGGVCENKVAVISDDGKTFSGTYSLHMQAALLLGASKDGTGQNKCQKSESHLLSSIYGGLHSNLSSCSEEAMKAFLKQKKECLKDLPEEVLHISGMLPAKYHEEYEYDLCMADYSGKWGDVRKCEPQYTKKNYTCRVQCCEYEPMYTRNKTPFVLSVKAAADGTNCGGSKICIDKACVEV